MTCQRRSPPAFWDTLKRGRTSLQGPCWQRGDWPGTSSLTACSAPPLTRSGVGWLPDLPRGSSYSQEQGHKGSRTTVSIFLSSWGSLWSPLRVTMVVDDQWCAQCDLKCVGWGHQCIQCESVWYCSWKCRMAQGPVHHAYPQPEEEGTERYAAWHRDVYRRTEGDGSVRIPWENRSASPQERAYIFVAAEGDFMRPVPQHGTVDLNYSQQPDRRNPYPPMQVAPFAAPHRTRRPIVRTVGWGQTCCHCQSPMCYGWGFKCKRCN